MSKPCCAIDVHTHVVPAHLPDALADFPGIPWPSIRHTDTCHAQVMISGRNYRSIDDACWSVPRRTEQMAGMDVGMQVLSRPRGPRLCFIAVHNCFTLPRTEYADNDASVRHTTDKSN